MGKCMPNRSKVESPKTPEEAIINAFNDFGVSLTIGGQTELLGAIMLHLRPFLLSGDSAEFLRWLTTHDFSAPGLATSSEVMIQAGNGFREIRKRAADLLGSRPGARP